MTEHKPEELIIEIYGKVCSIESTLSSRCKDREHRIEKLEKKSSWAYILGVLLVVSEVAYKIFK